MRELFSSELYKQLDKHEAPHFIGNPSYEWDVESSGTYQPWSLSNGKAFEIRECSLSAKEKCFALFIPFYSIFPGF